MLSPYLRHRLITEREVIGAVLGKHSVSASEKYVQEVCWRTYWKGWLELRPAIWTRFLADRDAAHEGMNAGLAKAVASAEAGTTGIEGFDDWARELVETGYLHNHARMWFASIWIFTLGLPWSLGADFFLRHLIDGDPASNTLSWRWVAGLQTQGKTYLATTDNIARYTDGRFTPKGLTAKATALVEPPIPKPRAIADLPVGRITKPALLLITGEDLCPESLLPADSEIRSIVIARGVGTQWPFGEKARAFVDAALDDCAARAKAHFACPVTIVDTLDADTLVAAAETAQVDELVTAYAPVGPIADALAALEGPLDAAGCHLVRRLRGWDSRSWPYATKGFFAFKEHIPQVLAEEGLRFR